MKAFTKQDLKTAVTNTGSCFFDRKTMKAFGDTMTNYRLCPMKEGILDNLGDWVECYALERKRPVKMNDQSVTYFDAVTFERVIPS